MDLENVNYSAENETALIEMDRPDALNALSRGMTADLRTALETASDEGARAIVLTSRGRAFCAGGDLREMQLMWKEEGRIEAFLEEPLKALHGLIGLIRELPIPIIAAVNGVCAGAGTNLALACDIVFASSESSFNQAFVKIGLSPDCGGTFFLPRAVGTKLAAEMFMTGDAIPAERAAAIGMINGVVESERLHNHAMEMANKLAKGPTGAIGRVKKMLNETFSNDLPGQLELEHQMQIESGRGQDFHEGVQAFFEKHPPKFSGN